ncbi:DUF1223 domain-containing protein [soil metagenome]
MTPAATALRLFGAIGAAAASSAVIAIAAAAAPGMAMAADRAHPVVVELFQSQGCSSCPPANANVLALSNRPDILALSFQVTYWDNLGWKDTFASPQYTDRQWEYARGFKHAQVYTPQVVINGRADVVGARSGEIEQAIARADRGPSGPAVEIAGDRVTVQGGRAGRPADVWLVRFDPNVVQVPIRAGENGGRTLAHKNVVRELVRLGDWDGASRSFTLPAGRSDLAVAILVQDGRGGPIIAAARA